MTTIASQCTSQIRLILAHNDKSNNSNHDANDNDNDNDNGYNYNDNDSNDEIHFLACIARCV